MLQEEDYKMIIDHQLGEITQLQSEVVELRNRLDDLTKGNNADVYYRREAKVLNELMAVTTERDEAKRQYNMVINSRSWRMTQFLRNMLWKFKGGK